MVPAIALPRLSRCPKILCGGPDEVALEMKQHDASVPAGQGSSADGAQPACRLQAFVLVQAANILPLLACSCELLFCQFLVHISCASLSIKQRDVLASNVSAELLGGACRLVLSWILIHKQAHVYKVNNA